LGQNPTRTELETAGALCTDLAGARPTGRSYLAAMLK
jgi:hypothetical protein